VPDRRSHALSKRAIPLSFRPGPIEASGERVLVIAPLKRTLQLQAVLLQIVGVFRPCR